MGLNSTFYFFSFPQETTVLVGGGDMCCGFV